MKTVPHILMKINQMIRLTCQHLIGKFMLRVKENRLVCHLVVV